jgi:hypothetical protein
VTNTLHNNQPKPEQAPDAFTGSLSERIIKPVSLELIFAQMIHVALCGPDPVQALNSIRERQNFDYGRAQQGFFRAFLDEERRAFSLWKEADYHVPEFFGCLLHDGKLFTNRPLSRFSQSLREDWISLMCEELEFLQTRPVWGLEDMHLVRHIGDNLIALIMAWKDRSIEVDFRLEQALLNHLASKQLHSLLEEPQSLSSAAALLSSLVATHASGYPSLTEEVAGLVPDIYAVCQELFPDLFCIDALEYNDRYDEDDEEDSLGEPSAEWHEVSQMDEELQLHQELEENQPMDILLLAWEGIFQHALTYTLILPIPNHRAKMFEELCMSSPPTMIAYNTALDGLALSSEAAFRNFAPHLISRALRYADGAAPVINITTLPQRSAEPLLYDPREVIVSELKNLPRNERNALLRSASNLIKSDNSPFLDTQMAKNALAFLRAAIQSPAKVAYDRKRKGDNAEQ